MFPVVGHSYNQCDRNFGLHSKKNKVEIIETVEEYEDIIRQSRNSPFIIVRDDQYEIIDYEEIFPALSQKQQREIKISKQRRLVYEKDGEISTYCQYYDEGVKHKLAVINVDNKVKKKVSFSGISRDKYNDVQELCRFLKPKNRQKILDYLLRIGIK